MTTDESIMEEMLSRATNPSTPEIDQLNVEMFCMILRSNKQVINEAREMFKRKISSCNVIEATKAITVLEDCMSRSDRNFQDEIGKFRFLNTFIQLVSQKQDGAKTPIAIKQRIMKCLQLWTSEFPDKINIRRVYDHLKEEVEVEFNNVDILVKKKDDILGKDEKLIKKLIESNDPECFKQANILIQHRVNQCSKRTEVILKHKEKIQEVEAYVSLLNQMLDCFQSAEDTETMNVIRELYMSCEKHKPIMENLTHIMDSSEEQLMSDTLETHSSLLNVMERYKKIVVHNLKQEQYSMETETGKKSSFDMLEQLWGDSNQSAPSNKKESDVINLLDNSQHESSTSPLLTDDLFKTFSEVSATNITPEGTNDDKLENLFKNFDLLEPTKLPPLATEVKQVNAESTKPANRSCRQLKEIDAISDDLFKKNLITNERVISFKKDHKKISLNELVEHENIAKTSPKNQSLTEVNIQLEPKKIRETGTIAVDLEEEHVDDVMLIAEHSEHIVERTKEQEGIKTKEELFEILPNKHLSEISIELDEIIPVSVDRVIIDDDDIKIMLNFTKNHPSKHVSVFVISTVNKSKLLVTDFQFEASVKKPSKVRLLLSNANKLPPARPFHSLAQINHIMLLNNPTGEAVDLTFIFGYKIGGDPDPIKESIIVKDIPFIL